MVQNVATYPNVRAIRKLGVLKKDRGRVLRAGSMGTCAPIVIDSQNSLPLYMPATHFS